MEEARYVYHQPAGCSETIKASFCLKLSGNLALLHLFVDIAICHQTAAEGRRCEATVQQFHRKRIQVMYVSVYVLIYNTLYLCVHTIQDFRVLLGNEGSYKVKEVPYDRIVDDTLCNH